MARRATFLKQNKDQSDFDVILDAGGFSRGKGNINTLHTEYLLKGYSLLDYSVINIGNSDLSAGERFLTSQIQKYQMDFISSNIFRKNSDTPFAKPYVIKTLMPNSQDKTCPLDSISIGFIGLCDNTPSMSFFLPKDADLDIRDPLKITKDLIKQLKKKTDILVLMLSGDAQVLKEILDQVSDIDVVFYGGSYTYLTTKKNDKWPIVVTTPRLGKYAGLVTLELDWKKKIISHIKKQIPLDENIADDSTITKLTNEFDKKYNTEIKKSHLSVSQGQ